MKKQIFILAIFTVISLKSNSQSWSINGSNFYVNPITSNVCIGDNTPYLSKLHVNNGTLRIGLSTSQDARNINMLKIGDGDYIKIGEWEADDRLSFYAGGGIKFNSTTTIASTLYANYIRIYKDNILYIGEGSTVSNYRIFQHESSHHIFIDFRENMYFRNWDDVNICPMVIEGLTGNVGIGFGPSYTPGKTHTQGYKLAVNGGILCEEVNVLADVPSADYVFNKDYKRITLSELDAFIEKNKHLPDVPSANEFKQNGYKVGQMDNLLLQKIEELTLYTIELNKEIEKLKIKNTELEKAINEK